jgi:glycosyltransferase involved in cell wall biosynthesis
MNLAIFSPSQNPYSETFIQAHKNYIKADKLYYIYGGSFQNMHVENERQLIKPKKQFLLKGIAKLSSKNYKYVLENEAVKRLKALKLDVALVEYGNHATKLLPVLKKANLPFVVHFHGYDASVKTIIEKNNNYKDLFEAANSVITVSTVMYNRLKDLGCSEHKLVYNMNGANPIFKERMPEFSKKQAIAIGRFVDKKAPYYTILAFQQVVKKHNDAKLIMAGQGVLQNMCKNLIRYLDLEHNVQLLGVITPKEVAQLMQESYCLVQHSITAENGDQEGTPIAVLEAALSGLPVVSTYHAGIPDVIEHEKTGLLCDEHDVDAMANNLIKIFDDVEFAKIMGQSARDEHLRSFSLERHIESLNDTLKKAMQGKI